jgi:hypothetical protein
MTYNEAKKVIDDNWGRVNPRMIDSKPPHMILRTLIAPEGSDLNTLATIDNFIQDKEILNDTVLEQMGLINNNLIPYIVYLMRDNNIIWPLDAYLGTSWAEGSGKAE